MRHKINDFRSVTGTKSAIHVTFVTPYGLAQNSYAGNVQSEITADDFFAYDPRLIFVQTHSKSTTQAMSTFSYTREWLGDSQAFALAPSASLQAGTLLRIINWKLDNGGRRSHGRAQR